MVRISQPFMNEILWPTFNKYERMFEDLVNEIMENLIFQIHQVKEKDEVVTMGKLPAAGGEVGTI